MKHNRKDYAQIQDPSGKIPEDEPVFLLRGQDPLAPYVIRKWADKVQRHGGDPRIVNEAYEQAEVMERWQRDALKHGPHTPDLPPGPPPEDQPVPTPPEPAKAEVASGAKAYATDPNKIGSTATKPVSAAEEIQKKLAATKPSKETGKAPAGPGPTTTSTGPPPKTAQTDKEIADDIARKPPLVS
jgi:hypothetical protein